MALWTLITVVLGITVTTSDALKVVYTRAYAGKDLGAARRYHAQYFEIARKSSYYTLNHWSSHYHCANYEANIYGDYMGFFHCNQFFEPYDFDYCCGKQGAHYCCPNSSLATPYLSDPDPAFTLEGWLIAVIVVTVLVLILPVIGVCIYCCIAACCLAKATKKRTSPQTVPNTPMVTVTSGGYPAQQPTGGYPAQQPTGTYPVQQPTGAYPIQQQTGAYPMTQPAGPYPLQPDSEAPPANIYSQPSDFGYAAGASNQPPPPSYSTVTQKM